MELTIIVGAGGTGSYFIEDVLHYYNVLKRPRTVVVVDGDVVETKNLLRQGFLRQDLGKGKAESLVGRYSKVVGEGIGVTAVRGFINSVDDLVKVVEEARGEEKLKSVTLVSCVDNNMARLRLTIGMYALRDIYGCEVRFTDSGNTEWFGQTITSVLTRTGATYLGGLHGVVEAKGLQGVRGYKVRKSTARHILASIFTKNDNWKDNLTRGDHEMSCEDVTESNPQNIGVNMMGAKCLLMTIGMLERKEFVGGEYNYDANINNIARRHDGEQVEEGYEARLEEILAYLSTVEGYVSVFGTEGMGEVVEVDEEGVQEEVGNEFADEDTQGIEDEETEEDEDLLLDDLLELEEQEDAEGANVMTVGEYTLTLN